MDVSGTLEDLAQICHTGEETRQEHMGRIDKYGANDVLGGYRTGGTDLYHHDTPIEREDGI